MAAARKMGPKEVEKFARQVCGDDMHAARVLSLANAVTGSLWASALAVSAIGAGLARARGIAAKHCVKQVDRLLSNAKLDVRRFFALWVPRALGTRYTTASRAPRQKPEGMQLPSNISSRRRVD